MDVVVAGILLAVVVSRMFGDLQLCMRRRRWGDCPNGPDIVVRKGRTT
jgi:hypothetical protein